MRNDVEHGLPMGGFKAHGEDIFEVQDSLPLLVRPETESINTLETLRVAFLKNLPATSAHLQKLWIKLCYFNWHAQAFRLFFSIINRLEKNCARLGLTQLREQSQTLRLYLQHFLERGVVPDAVEKKLIQNMVDALVHVGQDALMAAPLIKHGVGIANAEKKASAEKQPSADLTIEKKRHSERVGLGAEQRLIYLLDSDESAMRILSAELHTLGYEVVCFTNPDSLLSEVARMPPASLIMELVFPEGAHYGFQLAERIQDIADNPPSIYFLSARGDMNARLGAVRVGCDAFFTKPVDLDALLKTFSRAVSCNTPDLLKVLIVGGYEEMDRALVSAFTQVGILANYECNPLNILESIVLQQPDMLVCDISAQPQLMGVPEGVASPAQTEAFLAQDSPWALALAMAQEQASYSNFTATLGAIPIVLVENEGVDASFQKDSAGKREQVFSDCQVVARVTKSDCFDGISVDGTSVEGASIDTNTAKDACKNGLAANVVPDIVSAVTDVIHHAHSVHAMMQKLQRDDPVTGFLNRRHLLAALETALATASESHPAALFYISLDHVELLKKKAGLAWDGAMHQVASLLRVNVPEAVTAGRLDEETFVLIWPYWDRPCLTECAKNILAALRSQPVNLPHNSIHITASIGITVITPDLHDVPTVLNVSEHLARQAKKQGGNHFVEHADTLDALGHELHRESNAAIYTALEQESFRLVFQPILKTTDTADEMYEVLLRLNDPNNKTVSPEKFLPIVEENHLFPSVDRWVIQHAVDQLCHDAHAKLAASLFIKVSGESLEKKALLAWISNLKNTAGLRGHRRLVFEFSETEICEHLGQVENFVSGLPALDCGFTLDHFGCTDLGLALLDQLHVDYVKLHGPLVQSVLSDETAKRKVKSLIDKARQNDVEVIASAIETTKTMSLLWGWGVSHFQGHFIQQPHSLFDFDFKGIEL